MSFVYLLKPPFDQRLAARVMRVKERAHGMWLGSAQFVQGWPSRQEIQRDVRLHSNSLEEIDGHRKILLQSRY
jgi:hypothetical protein